MNERIFIIAGNVFQYSDFMRKDAADKFTAGDTSISLSNYIYVDSAERLKGYREPHGFFVGTWRERQDIRDILLTLSTCYDSGLPESVSKIMGEFFA